MTNDLIAQNIYELCEEISLKLRRLSKKARTVHLYLGGDKSAHGRKTLNRYFDSGAEIFELSRQLMEEWQWNSMVRQIPYFGRVILKTVKISVYRFLTLTIKRTKFQKLWTSLTKNSETTPLETVSFCMALISKPSLMVLWQINSNGQN